MFKEAPGPPTQGSSVRHFKEVSSSSSEQQEKGEDVRSHVNGRPNERTEERSSSGGVGMWESLTTSRINSKEQLAGEKEREAVAEEKQAFAKPTLTPSEMDALLMPPPSIPGPSKCKYLLPNGL